jgi:hypothetical protein
MSRPGPPDMGRHQHVRPPATKNEISGREPAGSSSSHGMERSHPPAAYRRRSAAHTLSATQLLQSTHKRPRPRIASHDGHLRSPRSRSAIHTGLAAP